jgi:hypothetical protein
MLRPLPTSNEANESSTHHLTHITNSILRKCNFSLFLKQQWTDQSTVQPCNLADIYRHSEKYIFHSWSRLKGENTGFFEPHVNLKTRQHGLTYQANSTLRDLTPRTSRLAKHTQVYPTEISVRNLPHRAESGIHTYKLEYNIATGCISGTIQKFPFGNDNTTELKYTTTYDNSGILVSLKHIPLDVTFCRMQQL